MKSGLNFARYCDEKLDGLIAQAKGIADQGKRSALYRQAQQIIHDQALWLPLAHPTAFALLRKEVGGYAVNPFGRQDFSRVSLSR
ncbi:Periplasmic dipeptide transport protein precursor [compost metagenome]